MTFENIKKTRTLSKLIVNYFYNLILNRSIEGGVQGGGVTILAV